MTTKIQEMKWMLHNYKEKKLLLYGMEKGYIVPYDTKLIEKLRNTYYGGIPASILLLSNSMSNGHCYDRALLLAKTLLDEEDDVKLVYADIDSLKLNPQFITKDNPLYADHCVVERITKDGQHLIYDTSIGLIYDKKIYWAIEHPKVRHIRDKNSIVEYVRSEEKLYPEDIERDKYILPLILPNIEKTYGRRNEMYSFKEIELLQQEIEHFKKEVNYEGLCKEIDDDMRRLGLKKQLVSK